MRKIPSKKMGFFFFINSCEKLILGANLVFYEKRKECMNKKSTAFAMTLLSASFLHADQNSDYENRLSAIERRMCVDDDKMRPEVCHWTKESYHFSLAVSALLWKAHEDDLDFVIRSNAGLSANARVVNPDFKWSGGVKVAAGYQVPHYKMDINLNWTYFNTHAHRHIAATDGSSLFSIWTLPSIVLSPATDASSHWKLHLNLLNLEMGGQFFPRRWLHLRPHIGLTSAWVRQKYDVNLGGFPFLIVSDDIDMKNRFWGIGPRAGIDSIWEFGCGISAFGNGAVSILYGFFDTKQHEDLTFTDSSIATTFLDEKDSFRTSRTILELSLGLRWDKMFKNNRYHLGLQLGWDNLILYKQNELRRFVNGGDLGVNLPVQGDLTIQGWSLKAMVGF
jgi:hypothetical protein